MKLSQLLLQLTGDLRSESQAQQLLQWLLQCSWSELMLNKEQEFPKDKEKDLEQALSRLKKQEPLAYIRGYQDFYKFQFSVNPHVLIPRSETELIVEKCIELVGNKDVRIFDLGTGSGCIGLSVALELPNSQVYLFDSSTEALKVAQANASSLSVSNVNFYHGKVGEDPFAIEECKNKVDFVLANPPYIARNDKRVSESVNNYEPHEALYAGNNGLEWIHKWLTWSYDYLKNGGYGIFEFGEGQHDQVQTIVEKTNYQFEKFIKDYSGKVRFVLLSK